MELSNSNKNLKGRIIEQWSENDLNFFEVCVGYQRHVLSTQNLNSLPKLSTGDLIEATINPHHEILEIKQIGGATAGRWNPLSDGLRWRRPMDRTPRMLRLQQRQEILRAIREDLYSQHFLEVETPLLVKGTCPDTHIESIKAENGYLVTSTEYQIKRLMVGGFEKVFTLAKNFRAGDQGQYHSMEFTMLEWARGLGSMADIEEDAIRFIRDAFQALYPGQTSVAYLENSIDVMTKPWERLTVREAFQNYLGLKNLEDFSLNSLSRACQEAKVELPSHFKEDKHLVLSYLLDLIQSYLGKSTPTFLQEWPAFMTSSAQISSKDPYVAERSELYIGGIEIADGFPFLRDAELQKSFFARELRRRKEEGKHEVALDGLYLEGMEQGLPPGAGMALGIDRLVMVLTGASRLSDVQAFSWEEI